MPDLNYKPFSNLPQMLEGSIKMSGPNELIPIFEGQYKIQRDEIVMDVTGKIYFSWLPSMGVKFEGLVTNETTDPFGFKGSGKFDLKIDDEFVSKVSELLVPLMPGKSRVEKVMFHFCRLYAALRRFLFYLKI